MFRPMSIASQGPTWPSTGTTAPVASVVTAPVAQIAVVKPPGASGRPAMSGWFTPQLFGDRSPSMSATAAALNWFAGVGEATAAPAEMDNAALAALSKSLQDLGEEITAAYLV